MALREKLVSRVTPLLEPGEQVEQVLLAQTGPSPWLMAFLSILIRPLFVKHRIIAVTDRAVVVVKAGWTGTTAKEVLSRLPRQTRLGPAEGRVWARIEVDGQRMWIHSRFHKDIAAADATQVQRPATA